MIEFQVENYAKLVGKKKMQIDLLLIHFIWYVSRIWLLLFFAFQMNWR